MLKKTTIVTMLTAALLCLPACGSDAGGATDQTASWGPQDRATFTWDERADYVTFNSITDNPLLGHEENFVRVRKAGTKDTSVDDIELEVGQEYEVSIFFDNDAKPSLNREDNGVGVARNVRLLVSQPENLPAGKTAEIKCTISADNANPKEVWDCAYAHTDEGVAMRYVPNSATVHLNEPGEYDEARGGFFENGYETTNGKILSSEALFGHDGYGGSMLGYYNDQWGTLPAGSEYCGYVTYRFVVDQPNFEMSKTVAGEGGTDFAPTITTRPGETLTFRIDYENTGTTIQDSIVAKDELPKGLAYVPGSTFFKSSYNGDGVAVSDDLFSNGLNLGDFEPGTSMYVTYKARVEDDADAFPAGDTVVYNEGIIGTQNGSGHDRTEITVHRD